MVVPGGTTPRLTRIVPRFDVAAAKRRGEVPGRSRQQAPRKSPRRQCFSPLERPHIFFEDWVASNADMALGSQNELFAQGISVDCIRRRNRPGRESRMGSN